MPDVGERIVFIGGLHRSGTTLVARWVASHPDVSGLSGTGVPEDEGQHLQSVYPAALAHGGPGRFALDPAARLTEASSLITPDAARRLTDAWAPYWDVSKPVLLEKSPPNLVRMRFLRALFPHARFLMMIRHPIAAAMATRKWAHAGMDLLMRNWLTAHRYLLEDAGAVGLVGVVRYEDLVQDPAAELDRIFSFLSLEPFDGRWEPRSGLNERYFSEFGGSRLSWRSPLNYRLVRRHQREVEPFGYSLASPYYLPSSSPELERLRLPPREAGVKPE